MANEKGEIMHMVKTETLSSVSEESESMMEGGGQWVVACHPSTVTHLLSSAGDLEASRRTLKERNPDITLSFKTINNMALESGV